MDDDQDPTHGRLAPAPTSAIDIDDETYRRLMAKVRTGTASDTEAEAARKIEIEWLTMRSNAVRKAIGQDEQKRLDGKPVQKSIESLSNEVDPDGAVH